MEYFVQALAQEQARAGHEVWVLAHAGQQPPGEVQLTPGLTVRRYRVWGRAGRGGYAPLAPGLLLKARFLGGFKPDLVHLHCPNPVGITLRPPARVPLILHWQSDVVFPENRAPASWQLRLWRFFERGLLDRAARVVTTSPYYADTSQTLRHYLSKVRVAPLGLRPEPEMAAEGPPGAAAAWLAAIPAGSRLLTVGRLSHYKGLEILLEALVHMPKAALCLIGQGEERARLETWRDRLGLGERVFFAGQVDEAEKERCLALTDVFCLPSLDRTESFGLVLLEAMRAGKACLATSVVGSGMSYALDEGRAGMLVTPGGAEPLAEAVSRLLADRELRLGLAEAGRARFLGHFTMSAVAAQVESIYREIL